MKGKVYRLDLCSNKHGNNFPGKYNRTKNLNFKVSTPEMNIQTTLHEIWI